MTEEHLHTKNHDDRDQYLRQMLGLDPWSDALQIVQRRNDWVDYIPSAEVAKPVLDGQQILQIRRKTEKAIDQIQRHFWTAELDKVQLAIDQLHVDSLPDLKLIVQRLQTVATVRDEWTDAFANSRADVRQAVERVLVVPQDRQAWNALIRFPNRDLNRFLKKVRTQFPNVYRLEQHAFGQALNRSLTPQEKEKQSAGGLIIFLMLLFFLSRVIQHYLNQ